MIRENQISKNLYPHFFISSNISSEIDFGHILLTQIVLASPSPLLAMQQRTYPTSPSFSISFLSLFTHIQGEILKSAKRGYSDAFFFSLCRAAAVATERSSPSKNTPLRRRCSIFLRLGNEEEEYRRAQIKVSGPDFANFSNPQNGRRNARALKATVFHGGAGRKEEGGIVTLRRVTVKKVEKDESS